MKYKLITNKHELGEDRYFEFFPGVFNRNQDKYWNNNSVYLAYDYDIEIILDLLYCNDNFSYDYDSFLSKEEIIENENSLKILISEIEHKCTNELLKNRINNNSRYTEDYKIKIIEQNNNWDKENIKKYRKRILKMLNDLVNWLKLNNEKGISILTHVSRYMNGANDN